MATTIQIKRTDKTLSSVQTVRPESGELVYINNGAYNATSPAILTIGNGSNTIASLPKLNLTAISKTFSDFTTSNALNYALASTPGGAALSAAFATSASTATSATSASTANKVSVTKATNSSTYYLNFTQYSSSASASIGAASNLTFVPSTATLTVGTSAVPGRIAFGTATLLAPSSGSGSFTLPSTGGSLATIEAAQALPAATVSTTAPANAVQGQLYVDPNTSVLYYYNDGWKPIVGVWG